MPRISPAVTNHRLELQQREEALAAMAPKLRDVYKRMERTTSTHISATIEFYYEQGCVLLEVEESPNTYLTPQQKADGVSPAALLLLAFCGAKDAMKRAMVFATLYTKADVHRLVEATNKNRPEFRFQWAHVRHLISVDPRDPESKVRRDFEHKTKENGWTHFELADAIALYYGGKRSKGGRPLSIPKTLKAQMAQVVEMSDLFLRRHKEVWNGPKHSIFVNIMQQPTSSLSGEAVAKLHAIKNRMADIQEAAKSELEMCERTLEYIEKAKNMPALEVPATATKLRARAGKAAAGAVA